MRTIILFIIYIFITILAIPLLFFCYIVKCEQPLILLGKWSMRLGQIVLGIHLEVYGRERIDREESYVFMPNHLSFLDGPLAFLVIPQPVRIILKKEVFKIPIIGLGMRHINFVPVDRKRVMSGKVSIDKAVRLIREKKFSFLIFPEGTRSPDGKLQTFRRGAFFLAINSQVPIVPVTLKGTRELMPKGHLFVKRGKIKVVFHPPVSVKGYSIDTIPAISEKVRNIIQSGLDD